MALYDENLLKREQTKIVNCYTKIGECYYVAHKDDVNPEFHELIDAVKASEKVMADHKAEVLRSRELMLCPSCGAEIYFKSIFCNFCGLTSLNLRILREKNHKASMTVQRFSKICGISPTPFTGCRLFLPS